MKALRRALLPTAFAAAGMAALAACGGSADLNVGAPPAAYGPSTPLPGSLALSTAAPQQLAVDAQITSALVQLAETHESFKRDLSTATSGTPEGDLLSLGSQAGWNLRNRYLDLGIPLSETFASNTDPVFRQQLIEMARWDRDSESRSAALLALARWHDIAHLQIFNEALINLDPGVRFAALEALVTWNHPREAMVLLGAAAEKDAEPLLRVYASAGLARLGDPAGLARLRQFLDDPSWLVKSLAAKYLGDFGTAEDYDLLLNRVDAEVANDFVVAEFCVSALKLYPKKKAAQQKAVQPPPERLPAAPTGNLVLDSAMAYELEPLVVTAPRVQAQVDLIDPRINAQLLRLLNQRMDARPDSEAALDASIGDLNKLTTVTGYNLQTRYTELGFLLTEGLAGTTDYQLQAALENVVRQGTNVQTRAAALTALAYSRDMRYMSLIQMALVDPNITMRFAGLEALLILGDQGAMLQVGSAARTDSSVLLQIYAAAAMWRSGDIFGREIMLRHYQDQDWLVRAMCDHYLGEMGGGYEYTMLQRQLDGETDQAVRAELLASLVKLNPVKDQ